MTSSDIYNRIYYEDIIIKGWEKERGNINHGDSALYGLDEEFIKLCDTRYRTHQKKQYEDEESRLLSQRVFWTDKLRQGVRRNNWYVQWRITEAEDSLHRVRTRLRYLSVPKKELQVIDIATVKQVPIGNIFETTAAGFFIDNPLRPENSPSNSLHWNKNTNKWTDYGSGEYGDNISLVMLDKKLKFIDACNYILKFQ